VKGAKDLLCYVVISLLLCPVSACAKGADTEKGTMVKLPPVLGKGQTSLEEAIAGRRSVRSFKDREVPKDHISKLLWSCQGVTNSALGLRAAPSAGGIYPLEIYLADKEGVFHYIPRSHLLQPVKDSDIRMKLAEAAYGQRFVEEAPICIVITAVISRMAKRYGDRAQRYVLMEIGHAAENLHLQAVSLGLGSCPVGAFSDSRVKALIGLGKDEDPYYIIPIGYPN